MLLPQNRIAAASFRRMPAASVASVERVLRGEGPKNLVNSSGNDLNLCAG